jgi:2,3-bisphosphoglycerate-dependent phosphoglycerate mutase
MAAATLAVVQTTLLLARHGETDWNRERRWQGHADPPLNDAGREQARELARLLAETPLDAVYSSDLRRARDTAAVVASDHGLEVVATPALREIDVGEWSGLTTDEIERRFPAGFARHADGGDGWEQGETHAAMSGRIAAAVSEIAASHPGGHVLCVCHGGVIRALLALAASTELGEYRRTEVGPVNGSVARVSVAAGRFTRID